MKRLVLTLTIALSLVAFSSFKNKDDIAPAAIKSFNNSFKSATEVSWSVNKEYYRANFSLNGQFVAAYFSVEGKMIAMTRNISSLQLPIALQVNMKKISAGYWISDLFEIANEEGTSYYITLEDADNKLIFYAASNSEWKTFKKQRKS